MTTSKSRAAVALFSGTLGAFLDSLRGEEQLDMSPETLLVLEQAKAWLVANNHLFRQFASNHPYAQNHHPLPLAELTYPNDEPLSQSHRPETIVNPNTFPPEVHNEDHRHFRLPESVVTTQQQVPHSDISDSTPSDAISIMTNPHEGLPFPMALSIWKRSLEARTGPTPQTASS